MESGRDQELKIKNAALEKELAHKNHELEIEAALEKVRARSLAMHKSDEIREVVAVVLEKVVELNIVMDGGVSLVTFASGSRDLLHWYANPDHVAVPLSMRLPYFDNLIVNDCIGAKQKGMDLFAKVYSFEEKNEYFKYAFEHSDFKIASQELKQWILDQPRFGFSLALQKNSGIFLNDYTGKLFSEEENEILKRFSRVFEQAYVRFLDLQKAEAQARQAQIEAGLERVRSRTMAMRSSDELAETAAVVFKQLIGLGIEPNRLFIGIINDHSGDIELWATDQDGSKISTRFTGNVNRNPSVKKMYQGWKRQKKSISIDMRAKELKEYFHYLSEELKVPFKLGLPQKRRIQSIAYFSKGFIGMASPDEQPAETMMLLERFAGVFNLTFVRFHDLKIAEAHAIQAERDLLLLQTEKKRAEDALTELKSTQTQLIQKEKMASLGELTAGIAHEIQNPLNFVNNFSEVSVELLQELKQEAEAGNKEDVIAIADDLVQNLQKINHHGKRADSIVKGMLEHSRLGTGQKLSTDLNVSADEFFKLSYHGLRAKDKSFNAKLVTHFDNNLPKIKVVQQDIGRVLINLFNNAFYAVNQRRKTAAAAYKPEVIVTTLIENGQVIVKVRDNGNGIPGNIKDKIMQPFFTTKPAGEGTGLGLSLSYDIVVKGHGGNITVNTQEGQYTEFIVSLPIS